MNNTEDIRWRQRFENLKKAFFRLQKSVGKFDLQKIEQAKFQNNEEELEFLQEQQEGMIKRFEYTYELLIQTLRDIFLHQGEPLDLVNGSMKILSQALQKGYIENHDLWREMVLDRNLTVHTYNQNIADQISSKIKTNYFPLMQDLFKKIENEY